MLLQELKPEVKPQAKKVASYLTPDWDRLVKGCESPTIEIPKEALMSREAFFKWMDTPLNETP